MALADPDAEAAALFLGLNPAYKNKKRSVVNVFGKESQTNVRQRPNNGIKTDIHDGQEFTPVSYTHLTLPTKA